MSYRPITDFWFLARPKVKYYGAYPNGFLERAKVLLGGGPTLHVCGGHPKAYPNRRLVAGDLTLDLDASLEPDFCRDARLTFPVGGWRNILCDPPYTPADADHYAPGRLVLPPVNHLLRNGLESLHVGGRIGVLHYEIPRPPKTGCKFLAIAAVAMGYGNRGRFFTVFERTS